MRPDIAITEKTYWDNIHVNREAYKSVNFNDYRAYIDSLILGLIKQYFVGRRLLEIGAGSSDWLINISRELNLDTCTGLDYSEIGCNTLKEKSEKAGVNVDIVCADIFSPPTRLIRNFNFVVSFGVVEHFKNLEEAMLAISAFVKPGGVLFTLIPNMAGLNGALTKKWNKAIYDIHVPHDLDSFVKGHEAAELDVVYANYLGSTNFGVVSSCFDEKVGFGFWLYKQLTRISKLVWLVEKYTTRFPATKLLSPYIVVVSRVPQ